MTLFIWGFPHSSVGKESSCNAGDLGSIPGLGGSPREEIGYPLQYSWASLMAQMVKKKKNPCNMGDLDLIPRLGRSSGGHGNVLQYSCLENPIDRGAWGATVHGITESDMTE